MNIYPECLAKSACLCVPWEYGGPNVKLNRDAFTLFIGVIYVVIDGVAGLLYTQEDAG